MSNTKEKRQESITDLNNSVDNIIKGLASVLHDEFCQEHGSVSGGCAWWTEEDFGHPWVQPAHLHWLNKAVDIVKKDELTIRKIEKLVGAIKTSNEVLKRARRILIDLS